MKISNETKIGALTLVSIVLLFLGFNFLKGKNLFQTGFYLYANYPDTKGLQPSNPVVINGYQVGTVYNISADDKSLGTIKVELKLNDTYNIPQNSVATIEANPLGASRIVITLGTSTQYLHSKDSIKTGVNLGMLAALTDKLGPTAENLASVLAHMDTLVINVNTVLNTDNKGSITSILDNLNKTTAEFAGTATSLKRMLDAQSGSISRTMDNVQSITSNMASNNQKINHVMSNLETTTNQLSAADIKGIVGKLNVSATELNQTIADLNKKLNSTNGTAGALLNDRQLYDNINSTVRSMNTLLDDLRVHPKRYVNISIFGKKDKGDYLKQPLVVDSITNTSTDK
ncbi:MAG: MlaD family protein [Chitinophagaceae bacterium]